MKLSDRWMIEESISSENCRHSWIIPDLENKCKKTICRHPLFFDNVDCTKEVCPLKIGGKI